VSGQSLCIGLLAYTQAQHRVLKHIVEECEHQVGCSLLVARIAQHDDAQLDTPIDAWVVDIDTSLQNSASEDSVDDWLDQQTVPVIVCDGAVPAAHEPNYADWARRLKTKLTQLAGSISLAQSREHSAKNIWVLGASTGGPAAVKQFLTELPPQLDIGFIYVQHINVGFNETLTQVMNKHTHYPARVVEHGDVIRTNEVAIVSPDKATEVIANSTVVVSETPWSAPYSPSIDSVVADVATHFGQRSGAIIFTGMGDDGAASSRMMRKHGGKVWVQTPGSCTSPSMPVAVMAMGDVDFKGTPFTLAQQLVKETQARRYATAMC